MLDRWMDGGTVEWMDGQIDETQSQPILITDPTILMFRSNFVGTQFTVYDDGVNPFKGQVLPDASNIREEMAAVVYVSFIHNNWMVYSGFSCVCVTGY